VFDFWKGGLIADWHADEACAQRAKTGLDPIYGVWEQDRKTIARRQAKTGQMPGEVCGALVQLLIGNGPSGIGISGFTSPQARLPAQKLRYARYQVRPDHVIRAFGPPPVKPC